MYKPSIKFSLKKDPDFYDMLRLSLPFVKGVSIEHGPKTVLKETWYLLTIEIFWCKLIEISLGRNNVKTNNNAQRIAS